LTPSFELGLPQSTTIALKNVNDIVPVCSPTTTTAQLSSGPIAEHLRSGAARSEYLRFTYPHCVLGSAPCQIWSRLLSVLALDCARDLDAIWLFAATCALISLLTTAPTADKTVVSAALHIQVILAVFVV
jgi:hypothetical protein